MFIELKISEKAKEKISSAQFEKCIDGLKGECQVVVNITNLDESVDRLVGYFNYKETWNDPEILEFATELVNKRFS